MEKIFCRAKTLIILLNHVYKVNKKLERFINIIFLLIKLKNIYFEIGGHLSLNSKCKDSGTHIEYSSRRSKKTKTTINKLLFFIKKYKYNLYNQVLLSKYSTTFA